MTTGAIIVAAGRGTRAGGDLPKQWQMLGDRSVAAHAMARFAAHPAISRLVLVLHPDDIDTALWPNEPAALIVEGGTTRAASVRAGLEALAGKVDQVLIHDAARPLVSDALINRIISALETLDRATSVTIITDSVYVKDGFTKWIHGWKTRGWKTAAKKPVKNEDLWRRLDAAAAHHSVTWEWVKGHAGHPENEKADALARAGMAPFKP